MAWAQSVVREAECAVGNVRQDRERDVLVEVALDEILVLGMVLVCLLRTCLVGSLVHSSVFNCLLELQRIINECILLYP